jgi:hypothetical protein
MAGWVAKFLAISTRFTRVAFSLHAWVPFYPLILAILTQIVSNAAQIREIRTTSRSSYWLAVLLKEVSPCSGAAHRKTRPRECDAIGA